MIIQRAAAQVLAEPSLFENIAGEISRERTEIAFWNDVGKYRRQYSPSGDDVGRPSKEWHAAKSKPAMQFDERYILPN